MVIEYSKQISQLFTLFLCNKNIFQLQVHVRRRLSNVSGDKRGCLKTFFLTFSLRSKEKQISILILFNNYFKPISYFFSLIMVS